MSQSIPARQPALGLTFPVLLAASLCHLFNDLMQSVFTATYPLIKSEFGLTFAQIGLLTLTYQMSASILQPVIGLYTDRRPLPYSLPFASAFSMAGVLTLAMAPSFPLLLLGGALLGIGSSIFHPEASRVARLAAGTSHGLAQSIFQVGGNLGSSLGPLVVVLVVLPGGLGSLAWLAFAALAGMIVLTGVSRWYARNRPVHAHGTPLATSGLPRRRVLAALLVLTFLMLSKTFYLASFESFYHFYLMQKFGVSPENAQLGLFAFLAAVAAGTLVGGPIGDRIGRKAVLWCSILGVLPFTLLLPYVGLGLTIALSLLIGFIMASAFSAIVVFAQSLMPHRIGMISGVFFGLLFGFGGTGAAVIGALADVTSIEYVYRLCAFLPAMGLMVIFLPETDLEQGSTRGCKRKTA